MTFRFDHLEHLIATTREQQGVDDLDVDDALAELRQLKSRIAELESRAGDVRQRRVVRVRWAVEWTDLRSAGWLRYVSSATLDDARITASGFSNPSLTRIIRITTYAVTRPLVMESRTADLTGYQRTDGVGHVAQALCSELTGMAWASWAVGADSKDVGNWPQHATRTEAEKACRVALRAMGYRVERSGK